MTPQDTPRKPGHAPLIIPADPLGGGLAIIDVEKAERKDHEDDEDPLTGPLGETTRKPYENEG